MNLGSLTLSLGVTNLLSKEEWPSLTMEGMLQTPRKFQMLQKLRQGLTNHRMQKILIYLNTELEGIDFNLKL